MRQGQGKSMMLRDRIRVHEVALLSVDRGLRDCSAKSSLVHGHRTLLQTKRDDAPPCRTTLEVFEDHLVMM